MDTIFTDALKRLDSAYEYADIDPEAVERLKYPNAIIQITLPLRKDRFGKMPKPAGRMPTLPGNHLRTPILPTGTAPAHCIDLSSC